MLIPKALILYKALNLMPFNADEKLVLSMCVNNDKRIERLDECIEDNFPKKYNELRVYKGSDGEYCAYYPYKPTIRYYGDREEKSHDPCFITPNYAK